MVADPSEKIVKEPGPGAPDRVKLLANLQCKHPRRGCTVVLPPKQRSRFAGPVDLRQLRDFLHSEGERIQREISDYLQLNHTSIDEMTVAFVAGGFGEHRMFRPSVLSWPHTVRLSTASWRM